MASYFMVSICRKRVGRQGGEAAMSVEENKALVRRFFEARVKTDLDALDKMLAPDFLSHTKVLPGHKPDREGYITASATPLARSSVAATEANNTTLFLIPTTSLLWGGGRKMEIDPRPACYSTLSIAAERARAHLPHGYLAHV